jgi:hypothetical protein
MLFSSRSKECCTYSASALQKTDGGKFSNGLFTVALYCTVNVLGHFFSEFMSGYSVPNVFLLYS